MELEAAKKVRQIKQHKYKAGFMGFSCPNPCINHSSYAEGRQEKIKKPLRFSG